LIRQFHWQGRRPNSRESMLFVRCEITRWLTWPSVSHTARQGCALTPASRKYWWTCYCSLQFCVSNWWLLFMIPFQRYVQLMLKYRCQYHWHKVTGDIKIQVLSVKCHF
jgi:hypothetical protein